MPDRVARSTIPPRTPPSLCSDRLVECVEYSKLCARFLLRPRLQVIGLLAVFADVQTLALFFFGHAQADDHVDDLVGDQRDHAGPDDGQPDRLGLDDELVR